MKVLGPLLCYTVKRQTFQYFVPFTDGTLLSSEAIKFQPYRGSGMILTHRACGKCVELYDCEIKE